MKLSYKEVEMHSITISFTKRFFLLSFVFLSMKIFSFILTLSFVSYDFFSSFYFLFQDKKKIRFFFYVVTQRTRITLSACGFHVQSTQQRNTKSNSCIVYSNFFIYSSSPFYTLSFIRFLSFLRFPHSIFILFCF